MSYYNPNNRTLQVELENSCSVGSKTYSIVTVDNFYKETVTIDANCKKIIVVEENLDNIKSLESTIESLKIEFDAEKESQKDVKFISSLLLKKFNQKSIEIQDLASQESLDEAKKSFIKALIFMTFQSRSLIKKINENDTKYDSMNTDLLLEKTVKANKIITNKKSFFNN